MEKSNQVQQDNSNLSIYERVRCVPKEAKKEIEAGRLKGKHDINLFVKKDGEWSKPIFGNGGNKLIANEKKYENGQQVYIPYLDDDAYKKAFMLKVHDNVARNYYITGMQGGEKGIALDRNLVEWECQL